MGNNVIYHSTPILQHILMKIIIEYIIQQLKLEVRINEYFCSHLFDAFIFLATKYWIKHIHNFIQR